MNTAIYQTLKDACLAAAKIQIENYKQEIEVTQKTNAADLVTEVDFKSQDAIIKSLTDSMMAQGFKKDDIGFIAEEKGVESMAEHLFIIDPLDGTGNYIEGTGLFCIAIAYFRNSQPVAGAVYRPTENTLCFAEKGKGAFCEKENLR